MTDRFSEDEAIAAVARLTRTRLTSFVEAQVVTPAQSDAGPVFRRIDLARMELLCELSEEFDLDGDALGIVISLIDQLHAARRDLHALAEAVEAEPDDVRRRVATALQRARAGES
ncbi:MAG: hypothetical protein WCD16_10735 [Paracoccaceae bacterium]